MLYVHLLDTFSPLRKAHVSPMSIQCMGDDVADVVISSIANKKSTLFPYNDVSDVVSQALLSARGMR